MKNRISILLLAVTLLAVLSMTAISHDALAAAYVGASTSRKFHYESCTWAQKIRPDHRVEFGSREDAVNAGFVACKVCKP